MKIKNMLSAMLVTALLCLGSANAQTVTVNGVGLDGIKYPIITWVRGVPRITGWGKYFPDLADGQSATIAYSHPTIPATDLLTTTETSLVQVNGDGSETELGPITFGDGNPAGGTFSWTSRSI